MKQVYEQKQRGFTLIELLLVVTLVAISIGITSDILLSLLRSYNKSNIINEIEQQSNFIGLKLQKELRNASNVTMPNPPNDDQIQFQDNDGNDVYYNYDSTNHNLYRSNTGYVTTAANALVSTSGTIGVSLTCGAPSCFVLNDGTPQIVDFNFVFTQAEGSPNVSYAGEVNVSDTIVIRNTY